MSHIVNTDSYESSQNQGLMLTTWKQWLAEDTLNSVLGKTTVIFNLSCYMGMFSSLLQGSQCNRAANFKLSVESLIITRTFLFSYNIIKRGHMDTQPCNTHHSDSVIKRKSSQGSFPLICSCFTALTHFTLLISLYLLH